MAISKTNKNRKYVANYFFIAEEIINNEIVICNAVQYNLSQKQQLKQFVIPIKIYMKLQIIKSNYERALKK